MNESKLLTEELTQKDKTEIKNLAKKEVEKYLSIKLTKEVKAALGEKANEKIIRKIVAASMVRLFRSLWNRKSFWEKDV